MPRIQTIAVATVIVGSVFCTGCAKSEDPARVELRARLTQETRLSPDELTRLREEVNRSMTGLTFKSAQDAETRDLDEKHREIVFGMLTDPAGLFDEGLKTRGSSTYRVLNAPGESASEEIEATRRLWIDVATLVPARFEFNYAVPSPEDYGFDLVSAPK